MIPGELFVAAGEVELKPGRRRVRLLVEEYRRPPDPSRLARAFLRSECGPRVRARGGARDAARHSGRHGACASSRASSGRSISSKPPANGASREDLARAATRASTGRPTGDRMRLADTDLIVEIERDLTGYGDELKFGGGKVIRDAMGQHPSITARRGRARHRDHQRDRHRRTAASTKPTSALRDGRIAGIGKAGNPYIMDGITPGMIVGASTEAIARREHDRHRGRDRHAHPLHLAAAGRRRRSGAA